MRFYFIILISLVLMSGSCSGTNKQLRKNKKSSVENTTLKTEYIHTEEPVSSIKEVEEKLVSINEKLPDPHNYFVIIGSFRHSENANKYLTGIKKDGFSPEILRNEAGLYRVSVLATDGAEIAREKIRQIRKMFPEYSDTWLLVQKQ